MSRYAIAFALICVVLSRHIQADDPPASDVKPFTIEAVEERYSNLVTKAEADFKKAHKLANDARVKAYKDRLTEATKAGDFDKAVSIKATLQELEKESDATPTSKRQRPKDAIKFQGRYYALIREPVTWHVAKRRCEEMGGRLIVADTQPVVMFALELCRQQNTSCWFGASDEETEGKWLWLNGTEFKHPSPHISKGANDAENFMSYSATLNDFNDMGCGRSPYICEWDR